LHAPKKWAQAIDEAGFKAHALTDHGTMSGSLPFFYAMKDRGLTPIIGCEFYFTDDPTNKEERRSNHLVLLAKDYDGYHSLLKLQQLSNSEGFYYKPRIGIDWLKKHNHGLVCLTACLGGVLSAECWREFEGEKTLGLEKRYDQFRNIFGKDFYVEFQGHASEDQAKVQIQFYERLRNRKGFQQVITNDCHYIHPDHAMVQTLLKRNAYGKSESAESYTAFDSLFLKTPKEVYETFTENHEYLPKRFVVDGMKATEEIVEKCRGLEFPDRRYLPSFPTKKMTSSELFKRLTTKRLKEFLAAGKIYADRRTYIERFAKEYKVITEHNLQDYFLIVWDICRHARSEGIYVGLGRGSSAGSLISYLLQIVAIDPIRYKLIFERFLNENRCVNGELPDIDLDFESERREEIKQYVVSKYGQDCVCEIETYGRLMLKSAIIDFGKLFEFSNSELLEITTNLDLAKGDEKDLEAAMEASPKLASMMNGNPEYHLAVQEIIGQVKTQSVHPAGVIICSEPIADVTPVKSQKKDGGRVTVTQAEDKYVIRQGMVKMDFLGLKEYDINKFIIENSGCKFTAENYVEKIQEIAWNKPCKKVWKMFQQGETDAVFQFASGGMKHLLKTMKASCINDLIAAVALYRPGCLENGWHEAYCRRKRGEEEVDYIHPDLEEVLGGTYGIIVFQEQFMEVFHRIGKIKLSDADTIRSALGKKDAEKLQGFEKEFLKGAEQTLKDRGKAVDLWNQIKAASGYSFNRSHSAVYALLAFISQYLKVNYPAYFWAAVFEWNTKKNDRGKLLMNLQAAKKMGIVPLMPDLMKSKATFTVKKAIPWERHETVPAEIERPRWSLAGISGLGPKAAAEIASKQPFTSFKDFYFRIHKGKVKWDAILKMAYAGAFDCLEDRRAIITWLYKQKEGKRCPKLTERDLLLKFHEVMGFFERPLSEIYEGIRDYDVSTENELSEFSNGDRGICVAGMVAEYRTIHSKKGKMGKARIVDATGSIELNFFSDEWASYCARVKKGNVLVVTGEKSTWGGKENLLNAYSVEIISS